MRRNSLRLAAIAGTAIIALAGAGTASAQRGGQRGAAPPPDARTAAPIDLTGYWVSVVSEDWRHRMATPRKGDYESVPLNGEGRRAADSWDLAADNASGMQCRAFGIGGIMRQPGRLHISWEDADTLRIDFDAGEQTRLLHFDKNMTATGEPNWQGYSAAEWQIPPASQGGPQRAPIGNSTGPRAAGGGGLGLRGGPPLLSGIDQGGTLMATTTHFLNGYLRKNGVPYSENAKITEYFNRLPQAPNGDVWLLVVTVVEDPMYLTQPFYTSTHFKLERDGSGFDPRPCRTAPPPP